MKLPALLLLVGAVAHAGPWVDDRPGHGYVSLSFSDFEASQYLAGPCDGSCNGSPSDGGFKPAHRPYGHAYAITIPYLASAGGFAGTIASRYTNRSAQLYGEVSLGKGLGFVASMPLVEGISQQGNGAGSISNAAQGDLVLGLKYQVPLQVKGLAFGPQVYFTAPTGDVNARGVYPSSVREYNQPFPLPSGNGTVDIDTRISAGYSFTPIPVFAIAEVGFHHHFNDATCNGIPNEANPSAPITQHVSYSDDVPWTVQIGGTYQPKKHRSWFHHFTVIGIVHGTKSLENGFIDKSGEAFYARACGQANNTTFLSAGGQLMLFPSKWVGITYGIEHVLVGGNVGYGLTNTLGVATQF